MRAPTPIPQGIGCLTILLNPERAPGEVAVYDCFVWEDGRAWETIVEAEDGDQPDLDYLHASLALAPEDFAPVA